MDAAVPVRSKSSKTEGGRGEGGCDGDCLADVIRFDLMSLFVLD